MTAGPTRQTAPEVMAAVREFVAGSFAAVGNRLVPVHLERTVFWLQKLAPDAGPALLIAALAHDIERAFREEEVYARMFASADAFRDPAFLAYHQQRSARIIGNFLASIACPDSLREEVCRLVSRHEVGGDPASDLLKDADSLSFFENNVKLFVTVKTRESSPAKVRAKFDWMFQRLSLPAARKLCRPLYEAALARLEESGAGEKAEGDEAGKGSGGGAK